MTKFSEYLQAQLDERGWKQSDFARAAGTSSKNVSVWISKNVIPDAENLAKIARAFGVAGDEVRKAAGEPPRAGYFQLSPELRVDADTLDREQSRIVNDLIRKFAEDNREKVMGNAEHPAPTNEAGDQPAQDELQKHRDRGVTRKHTPRWDLDEEAANEGEPDIEMSQIEDDST